MKNEQQWLEKRNKLWVVVFSLLVLLVYATSNRYMVCGDNNALIFDKWTQTTKIARDCQKAYIRKKVPHYYHKNRCCKKIKDEVVGVKLVEAKAMGCEPCPTCIIGN